MRELRLELDQLLTDKIQNPHMDLCTCPKGSKIIDTIVKLISTQWCGTLQQLVMYLRTINLIKIWCSVETSPPTRTWWCRTYQYSDLRYVLEFDLCNTPVRSCLCTCIFLHVYECEHNFYTGFKDWCTCIDHFLVCSNLSFFLVPTSINDDFVL